MYDSRQIANLILDLTEADGHRITNLQLQKLLYMSHGYYLTRTGQPLVNEEFEAWAFGPVSRSAYSYFRVFGDAQIVGRAKKFDPVKRVEKEFTKIINSSALSAVQDTVSWFAMFSAFDLVEFTHAPGTPWSRTIESAKTVPNVGMIIRNDLIIKFFEGPEIH